MDVRLVDAERAARLRKVAEGLMCNGGYADRIRGSGIIWTLAELDLLDDIENALTAGKQVQGMASKYTFILNQKGRKINDKFIRINRAVCCGVGHAL